MSTQDHLVITATIAEFSRLSGSGRTRVYELIGNGSIDSILIGKRRLVVIDSYRRLVERQRPSVETSSPRAPVRVILNGR
ncbi:MAG TPA: hypothetical protein VMF32_12745 [Xanthobacteraceae bacterium]|nr:hypothetical protein [Xanthobacteraceae bacterium]